jgi:hypothetical protein
MTHKVNEPRSSWISPPQSRRKRLGTWAWYGALAGLVFSSPGVDLTFDNLDPVLWFGGTLSMVVLFGLPAGIILGWLDSRRGNKNGWQAVVKVPASLIGGSLFLFGIFAIPITIDVLSRWGSEAVAGAVGNSVLRRVIGTLAGACFGLTVPPLLMMSKQFNDWAYPKLPMAPEGQAEQSGEPEPPIVRDLES